MEQRQCHDHSKLGRPFLSRGVEADDSVLLQNCTIPSHVWKLNLISLRAHKSVRKTVSGEKAKAPPVQLCTQLLTGMAIAILRVGATFVEQPFRQHCFCLTARLRRAITMKPYLIIPMPEWSVLYVNVVLAVAVLAILWLIDEL